MPTRLMPMRLYMGKACTSLQFRDAKGGPTHEIQSNISAPSRLRIEKRGDFFYMFLTSAPGESLRPSGASIKLPFRDPFTSELGFAPTIRTPSRRPSSPTSRLRLLSPAPHLPFSTAHWKR